MIRTVRPTRFCDNIPPAPEAVAPPLDRDITTTVIARTEYYFTGSDPIQQGVAPGTIDPARTVVISGRVLDTAEEGLPGVRVEIAGRPEFGHTFTRSDGAYDLVANGGGRRVVRISRDGYVSGFRVVETNTQSYRHADDIIPSTAGCGHDRGAARRDDHDDHGRRGRRRPMSTEPAPRRSCSPAMSRRP